MQFSDPMTAMLVRQVVKALVMGAPKLRAAMLAHLPPDPSPSFHPSRARDMFRAMIQGMDLPAALIPECETCLAELSDEQVLYLCDYIHGMSAALADDPPPVPRSRLLTGELPADRSHPILTVLR